MKRLLSIVWAAVFLLGGSIFAGVPEPAPEPAKAPVVEKPTPELRAKAEAAINAGILEIFRKYTPPLLTRSRSSPADYTMALVDTAPGKISATPERQPFEILRTPREPNSRTILLLQGYYDARTNSLQVNDGARYVAAAEHPSIKSKLALVRLLESKPTPPQK